MIPLAWACVLPICAWMFIALVYGSLPLSCVLFFVVSVCLPAEFASYDIAGLTWTLDRAWLLLIAAQFAIKWYRGETAPMKWESTDFLLVLFLIWLVARTLSQPLGVMVKGQPPTLMHLINGYAIPAFLFLVLRFSKLDSKQLEPIVWCLGLLGLYLSLTALFEVAQMWSLVYPKFIADPDLGIHFGRARGPMLQSVRLGMCLLLVLASWIVFTVWLRPTSKPLWLITAMLVPLQLLAVFLTYTRSVWMAAGLVVVLLVAGCLQGAMRRLAIVGLLVSAMIVVAVKGPDLVAFKREYSAAETRESTYMRASFAYVSWKMFQDRPLMGFGFNQFQVANRPYLADRSTNLRLESIRGYVHHNSFLSLLVDLGLIGLGLYLLLLIAFIKRMLCLWVADRAPTWARGIALVSLAVVGVHLLQMAFHEVSFSVLENSMLLATWGLTASCCRQFVTAEPAEALANYGTRVVAQPQANQGSSQAALGTS